MSIHIHAVHSKVDLSALRDLFAEYAGWLNVDLTFCNFREELENLPSFYAPPAGCLLLATTEAGHPVGCVGVRPLRPNTCEMKRLYLRESARGFGTGYDLAAAAIAFAQSTGLYSEMLLDTLPRLAAAIAIFQKLDFQPIPSYYPNPVPGALFFRKELTSSDTQF